MTADSHRADGPNTGDTEADVAEANESDQAGTTVAARTPTTPNFDFSNATADREPFNLGDMPFYGKDRNQRLLSAVRPLFSKQCFSLAMFIYIYISCVGPLAVVHLISLQSGASFHSVITCVHYLHTSMSRWLLSLGGDYVFHPQIVTCGMASQDMSS